MPKPRREPTVYAREYRLLLATLRRAREEKGINQAELARRLKLHQTAVSKFEIGDRLLDVVRLRAWCKALGVDFLTVLKDWDKQAG